jgi:hypothetical protein
VSGYILDDLALIAGLAGTTGLPVLTVGPDRYSGVGSTPDLLRG